MNLLHLIIKPQATDAHDWVYTGIPLPLIHLFNTTV